MARVPLPSRVEVDAQAPSLQDVWVSDEAVVVDVRVRRYEREVRRHPHDDLLAR